MAMALFLYKNLVWATSITLFGDRRRIKPITMERKSHQG